MTSLFVVEAKIKYQIQLLANIKLLKLQKYKFIQAFAKVRDSFGNL